MQGWTDTPDAGVPFDEYIFLADEKKVDRANQIGRALPQPYSQPKNVWLLVNLLCEHLHRSCRHSSASRKFRVRTG
jgi:hypothetical protein